MKARRTISLAFIPRATAPPRAAFTLIELLVVVAIIGVLVALLLPAVQAAREAARQTTCRNNLKQQGLALQAYHAAHKQFPTGARMHVSSGKKSIGWHVLILPYIEQRQVYDAISPDADGGALNFLGTQVIPTYICPTAAPPSGDDQDLESANYVGVAGAGISQEQWPLEEKKCGIVATDGLLYLRSDVSAGDVSDGMSQTLALGERTVYDKTEFWSEGAACYKPKGSPDPASACVAATKHVVWPINALESRRVYFVNDAAAPAALRKVLKNELAFGSQHPGGAHFAFADGSVHYLQDDLDLTVYRALATRQGGEADAASF
ncbi:MAG: DUF1559 domain-containing protein [Planctomycetales bacterium]|nr:DUF1559 domain-containing protein [Planctomycetales bacterium]